MIVHLTQLIKNRMSAPRGFTWTAIVQNPDGTMIILGICKDIYDLIYNIGDDDYFPEHSAEWKHYWQTVPKDIASNQKKSIRKTDGGEIFRLVKETNVRIYSIRLVPNYHRW